MHAHTWEDPEIYQMCSVSGKSKWLAKGSPKEMSHINNSNYHEGLSFWVCSCVYPHTLYLFFLINTCFTIFCLCGNSFLQSRGSRALVIDYGLVARICNSHRHDPASISGWEPKPHSKSLQAKAIWDQLHYTASVSTCVFSKWSCQPLRMLSSFPPARQGCIPPAWKKENTMGKITLTHPITDLYPQQARWVNLSLNGHSVIWNSQWKGERSVSSLEKAIEISNHSELRCTVLFYAIQHIFIALPLFGRHCVERTRT